MGAVAGLASSIKPPATGTQAGGAPPMQPLTPGAGPIPGVASLGGVQHQDGMAGPGAISPLATGSGAAQSQTSAGSPSSSGSNALPPPVPTGVPAPLPSGASYGGQGVPGMPGPNGGAGAPPTAQIGGVQHQDPPPQASGGVMPGITANGGTAAIPGPSTAPPPAPAAPGTNPATGVGTPSTTPGTVTPFTSGSNLIGDQINPGASANTMNTQAEVNAAAQNVGGFNYEDNANQQFQTMAQQTAPAYAASIRAATQAAAANGGIGSGNLSTTYGNLANQRDLQLTGEEQTLDQNAALEEAQNQYSKLSALQGLQGQEYGQDITNEQGLTQQQQYQEGLQQQGVNNSAAQTSLEAELQAQNYNENLDTAEFAYSGSPSALENQQAGQYGAEGTQLSTGLQNYAQQQALNQGLPAVPSVGGGQIPLPYIGTGSVPQEPMTQVGQQIQPTLQTSPLQPDLQMDPDTEGGF